MARGRPGLTGQILIAMVLGVVIGSLLHPVAETPWVKDYLIGGVLHVVSNVFVISLKMLVVPLVFVSLVCGASALGDPKKLGRIGGKTMILYLGTTATAITMALLLSILVAPGNGFERTADVVYQAKEAPSLAQVFIDIFPSNPIKAMADGNMLQIIVFSILFGISLALVGRSAERVRRLFEELNEVVLRMVGILMLLAPYGVFALLTIVFSKEGFEAIAPLAKYFFLVLCVLILHLVFVYGGLVSLLARLNPVTFFRKMRPVLLFAFSTSSSNATLPVTMRVAEKSLGIDNRVASFTLPLGATVNMDGTAIMQGCATVFIAQAYGIDLVFTDYLSVILTATLASVGTAGVPSAGLIMLAMVLQQVGLPVEGIGLIIGVDRLLDMTRTAVNVSGDVAVTMVVAKSEGQFDARVYQDPLAGEDGEEERIGETVG